MAQGAWGRVPTLAPGGSCLFSGGGGVRGFSLFREVSCLPWQNPAASCRWGTSAFGTYGDLWAAMGAYGDLWGPMGAYGGLLAPLGTFGGVWGPLGTFGDLWGSMGTYGGLWGSMGTYGGLWGPMGTYGDGGRWGLIGI